MAINFKANSLKIHSGDAWHGAKKGMEKLCARRDVGQLDLDKEV
jgi:hypothetical protein